MLIAGVAAAALTLGGVSTNAEAASYTWYNAGYNDVQNGSLNAQVYSNGNRVSKAKVTYRRRKVRGFRLSSDSRRSTRRAELKARCRGPEPTR